MMRTMILAVLLTGCGSGSHGGDGGCEPVTCTLFCEHGFARGPDGCAVCSCAPAPDERCASDGDCAIARDVTGCCGCFDGHAAARVAAEPCLVARGETPTAACLPDPELCATVDCAACAQVVRAVCEAGACVGSDACAAGEVVFGGGCAPACASHADCTLAADYGVCCGGCTPAPVAFVEGDPCWAPRQSESSCAPAPGACDGLGCPSPASDCTAFGGVAVCMADGTCELAGADGGCPPGSSETSGVCVPD